MVASYRISKSSKLLCMSSLPANMKRIQLKIAEKCDNIVLPIISQWFFFICSRAANSVVCGRIRPNFELIQALMHVIVTCEYQKGYDQKHSIKRDDAVFFHYNSMGAVCCHGNQSSELVCTKTPCSLSPTPMMLQIQFDCNRPAGI